MAMQTFLAFSPKDGEIKTYFKHYVLIKCSSFHIADGDKKAYSETSQYAIKMKKDLIKKLREENKNLRAKLSRKMEVGLIMLITSQVLL